jgi:hypothetical protein
VALEGNFRREQGSAFRKDRQLQLRHPQSFAHPRTHSQAKVGSTQFPPGSKNHGARSGVLKLVALSVMGQFKQFLVGLWTAERELLRR